MDRFRSSSRPPRLGGKSPNQGLMARKDDKNKDKLPTMADMNREIMSHASELMGKRQLEPPDLSEWIENKRGKF